MLTSAVSSHSKENNHNFDVIQNAEIVETCKKSFKLDPLESYYIQQFIVTTNKQGKRCGA